jgi:hypothetical protein
MNGTLELEVVTSPLVFLRASRRGTVAFDAIGRRRRRGVSRREAELMLFFLEPAPAASALAAGFTEAEIRAGLASGILLDPASRAYDLAVRWENAGWSRAACLTFSQFDVECLAGEPDLEELAAPGRLDSVIRRRTVRRFSSRAAPRDVLAGVLSDATSRVRLAAPSLRSRGPSRTPNSPCSWLRIYVVVQRVEDVAPGIYLYAPLANELRRVARRPRARELAACVQSQPWIAGGGWCCFLVAEWERFMRMNRCSRGYMDLLIRIGEFAQECLQAAYPYGLGAWVTVAVDEERASRLLGLDRAREEALYFLKIGYPDA